MGGISQKTAFKIVIFYVIVKRGVRREREEQREEHFCMLVYSMAGTGPNFYGWDWAKLKHGARKSVEVSRVSEGPQPREPESWRQEQDPNPDISLWDASSLTAIPVGG